jgi:chromate transporter
MKTYLILFWIFAKIGTFTLGGGYAMLPLIERELVDKGRYLDEQEFLDATAVAQAAPGILAINIAILSGYKMKGFGGSVCCALGAALPSFIIILLIALFFHNFKENPIVQRVFLGIRPAVVALIAVPVFRLAKTAGITYKTAWLPAVSALLVWLLGVSPVYVVLAAGLGGFLYGRVHGGAK